MQSNKVDMSYELEMDDKELIEFLIKKYEHLHQKYQEVQKENISLKNQLKLNLQ